MPDRFIYGGRTERPAGPPCPSWENNGREERVMSSQSEYQPKIKSASSSLLKRNIRKFMNNKLRDLFGLIVVVVSDAGLRHRRIYPGVVYHSDLTSMKSGPQASFGTETPSDAICSPVCCMAAVSRFLSACSARY